jgi:DNA helicase-2/ATP-dependent DNA helicase PcrA
VVHVQLTPEQVQVAQHLEGSLLVLAAVGSGKTTTLSERIATAVASGISPARILALTFTNRAAQRMRQSLVERDAVAARRVHVHTFHALCSLILRAEARKLGLPPELWIHDEEDAEAVMAEAGVVGMKTRDALYKLHGAMSDVPLGQACVADYHSAAFIDAPWARRYIQLLSERGAIDFAGLVYLTRAALTEDPVTAKRWAGRFDLVQIDEVQDTHLSEYDVIRHLAASAQSLCLVGDLDQTIYGWRGSQPAKLLEHMRRDFGPVTELDMSENFRSTQALLSVASTVAAGLEARATKVVAHSTLPAGEPPSITAYGTPEAEASGIARKCADLLSEGISGQRVAILTRANWTAGLISDALKKAQVPAATVDTFRFFRRMEIKDALALLKLVVDRNSPAAAQRIALRLVRGVGKQTIERMSREGQAAGLRIVDFIDTTAASRGDPLWGLTATDVIVLDTETTGVDPSKDEVIEVAAVRLRDGVEVDHYQALIRPTRPVGDSEAVHHLSDALLAAEGRDGAAVMAEFMAFCGESPVAGHNVRFDLRMLTAQGLRAGVPVSFSAHFDTLSYARRLLRVDSYRLGDLAAHLGLTADPTHRALDDVRTTVQLLDALREIGVEGAQTRTALLAELSPAFDKLRAALDRWAASAERPGALARRLISEGGLGAYYRSGRHAQTDRAAQLDALPARLDRLDTPELPPIEATRRALDRAALAREQDLLDEIQGVRVLTIHQSKGLEFDVVFVPGLVDGYFPNRSSIAAKDTEEERRVFYVAVTRARQALHLSWYERNRYGQQDRSRFLHKLCP